MSDELTACLRCSQKIDKNSNLGFSPHLLKSAYHFLYPLRLQDFWFDSLHSFGFASIIQFFTELQMNLKIVGNSTDGYCEQRT